MKTGSKCGECNSDLVYVDNPVFGWEPGLSKCPKCKYIIDRPMDLTLETHVYKE